MSHGTPKCSLRSVGTSRYGVERQDVSESQAAPLTNGPESRFVVDAIDALLHGDVAAARLALLACADDVGWPAIAHRLEVAGRALTVDAGFTLESLPAEIDLVPEVLHSVLDPLRDAAPRVLARWSDPDGPAPTALDDVWPSLAVVAWLIDTAGYPGEVVV